MASLSSFTAPAELVDYAATKAAVLALYDGLGEELKYRYDAPEIQLTTVHPTYVNTKLINPYSASLLDTKALVLEPETVADAVVKQVLSGRGAQLILPSYLGVVASARAMPAWFGSLIGFITRNDIRAVPAASK